ncbi:MAG: anti-sigma regulatory factor [Dehalococcoidia bacterium]
MELKHESDVVMARLAGRDTARRLGFGSADQTRLATAISELGRSIVQNKGSGVCLIRDKSSKDVIRVQVVVEGHGPGIPDIDQALTEGRDPGAGLPAAKRLMQEFNIESEPGHTKITIAMARRRQKARREL